MKLVTVKVFHEKSDEYEAQTFACVATSATEAVRLVNDYVGANSPYKRIEADQEVTNATMDGPAQVLGPMGAPAFTWGKAT